MAAVRKTRSDFVETATAADLLAVVRECHEKGWIGAAVGAPGVGKTEALKHYAKKNPNADYLELNHDYKTASGLIYGITKLVNGYATERTQVIMKLEAIKTALDRRYNKSIVILDEAQELRPDGLRILKDINNYTGVALFLAGNPNVLSRLRDHKGERLPAYDQVDGRIRIRRRYLMPTADDICILARHNGIEGEPEINFLMEVNDRCERGLRAIDDVIWKAFEICEGHPIDVGSLRDAASELGLFEAKPKQVTPPARRRAVSVA